MHPADPAAAATPLLLGIDLGGTKSAALIGTPQGEVLLRRSAPTPAREGPDAVTALLVRLAREVLAQAPGPVAGIGVSAGAPSDARTGRVFEAPNLPGWGHDEGIPLADRLSAALDGLTVALENDANATALAEHRFGAGRGAADMAFLTVGTGIGAGLILRNRLFRGATEAGGEIGHVAVEPGGRPCACGLRGCLEAYASGPSLARIAVERGFRGEPTGQAVVEAARTGNEAALDALAQAAEMLGRGIATLCMVVNPEVVVLGTLAVHAGDLLLPRVRQVVARNTWPRIHQDLRVVPAALGDRAQDLAALCAWLARGDGGDAP
jgi:glucokinase